MIKKTIKEKKKFQPSPQWDSMIVKLGPEGKCTGHSAVKGQPISVARKRIFINRRSRKRAPCGLLSEAEIELVAKILELDASLITNIEGECVEITPL